MPRIDPRNTTRYWLDRHVPGLSLLSADFTTHEYPSHVHEALLIAITEVGGSEIRASGRPDEAHAAALLVVNPMQPHSSRMNRSRRWRYRSLYLEESALAEVMSALGLNGLPDFSRNIFRDQDLIGGFSRLHHVLEEPADPLRQRELLIAAFAALVGRHGSSGRKAALPPPDPTLLRAIVGLMRERCAEPLTLPEVASFAGLTQFQLIALFRRGVGMTPHAYLTQVRLEVARDQLRRGVPIAEAAVASGFYDQAALTRYFKRCYGFTPLQFARAWRS